MTEYIYFLIDPNTQDVKYVGKSKDPKKRFRQHIKKLDKSETPKKKWLLSLFEKKQIPVIKIIEKCEGNGRDREEFYFNKHIGTIVNIHNPGKGKKSRKLK